MPFFHKHHVLRAYRLGRLPGLQSLISFPDAEIVVHLAPCWKLLVHRPHKMLAVLSKSMRSLFMQEFSPYICMLVRFNMTKLESFTTMFLEGHPGQYHGTLIHAAQLSYASRMPLLKRLTISFLQRVTCASLKNSFHAKCVSFSQGLLSGLFVGLEGRNFPPVTYFQLH